MRAPHKNFFEMKEQRIKKLLLLGLGFVIAIELGFTWITNTFMVQTGFDIMSFEFARTSSDMNAVLAAWKDIMPMIWVFFALDMIFPVMYALSLSMLTLLIYKYSLRKIMSEGYNLGMVGLTLTAWYAAWMAACSDYIENLISIYILMFPGNYAPSVIPWLSFFVHVKFTLLAVSVIGILLEFLGFLVIYLISRTQQE